MLPFGIYDHCCACCARSFLRFGCLILWFLGYFVHTSCSRRWVLEGPTLRYRAFGSLICTVRCYCFECTMPRCLVRMCPLVSLQFACTRRCVLGCLTLRWVTDLCGPRRLFRTFDCNSRAHAVVYSGV